jgi:hypothetical protein
LWAFSLKSCSASLLCNVKDKTFNPNPRKAETGGVPPNGSIPFEWLYRTKVMIVWDDMLVLAWRIARWASALRINGVNETAGAEVYGFVQWVVPDGKFRDEIDEWWLCQIIAGLGYRAEH